VRKLLVTFCLISTFLTGVAQAELDIVITEGIKRRPVAVVPFGWQGNSPNMPLDIDADVRCRHGLR